MNYIKFKIGCLLLFALFFIGCINKQAFSDKTSNINASHKEANIAINDSLKIKDIKINRDTVELISTDEYLYYPFGKFKNLDQLTGYLKNLKHLNEYCYTYNDSTTKKIKLETFTLNNSYIKICLNEDEKVYQIVYAKIINKDILLRKNIHVGISKENFIKIFSRRMNYEQIKNIHVIKLVSGLLGVWQYYYFTNNTLTSIIIDSDYQLNKNVPSL
jgi:hypothetical protein